MAQGSPVFLPRNARIGNLNNVMIDRCIVTADSDASSDDFNILINDSDADTDLYIPIFVFPQGTIVLDIGVAMHTEVTTAADIIVGDINDSDGWIGSDSTIFACSDLSTGIHWASAQYLGAWNASTVAQDATTTPTGWALPLLGGKIYLEDSDEVAVTYDSVMSCDTFVIGERRTIGIANQAAVAEAGFMSYYIKYVMMGLQWPNPAASDLGTTGD